MDPYASWLPAILVRGEGIFLEFNLPQIEKWITDSPAANARIAALSEAYNEKRIQRGQEPRRSHLNS